MALTYGVMGVFALGVTLDWALIVGAVLLAWNTWGIVQQHTNRFFIHIRRTT
jgi:hypothetical protein